MFIPVRDKKSGGREVLVNMDFVSTVLVSNEGLAVLLFVSHKPDLYETLTPYEEVKEKLLDWQERVRTT